MCEIYGGNLVVINDAVENGIVYQILSNNDAGNSWLGMSDIDDEGFWKTIYGDQIWIGVADGYAVNGSYTNWGVNEPNDVGGGQDCGLIGYNGFWDDYYCSGNNNRYFLIEFLGDGCTDPEACNYDETVSHDDGSCEYAMTNYDCDGNCLLNIDCAGVCGGTLQLDECGICNGNNSTCSGYIQQEFQYCIDIGANLISCPCEQAIPITQALPSEIANNLTGIIGQGVAATNQGGTWMGSLDGLGDGNGYWFKSNVNACFNYNCAEN